MRRPLRRLAMLGGATCVAAAALVVAPSVASAASVSGTCTAYKYQYEWWFSPVVPVGEVSAKVNLTLNYTRNANGTITVQSVSYSFTDAQARTFVPGVTFNRNIGGSSNINVKAPVTRSSPDSMGTAGTFNFADFTVAAGTQVRVEGIPDFPNADDPACSVYFRP
ncbi:MAG: hypothetical protein Q7V88_04300 [Actinomycetota bacterium]|nr:hypothetical protein [Actinomycetota bacterium]